MSDAHEATTGGELPELERGSGPWSFSEAPPDESFIDFGPLKVPAFPSLNARIEEDPASKRIGAVSVRVDDCQLQLQVLAAPRGEGAWHGVRRAITRKVTALGGSAQALEGEFGTELIVTLSIRTHDNLPGAETARYVGIDGDRWTLRAVVNGPSALRDSTVERVNSFLTRCAVERGDEALASGRVMELAMPAGRVVTDSGSVGAADDGPAQEGHGGRP
jgi:hypothetical protein